MPESCTIYCQSEIQDLIARELPTLFTSVKRETNKLGWSVLEASEKDASIRFTCRFFRERGDDFCRLLLSTCTFIESGKWQTTTRKNEAIRHVEACEMAIGVVAEPGFESDDRFNSLVFAIARAGEGVVFNGTDFLDKNEKCILSQA
ncbi:MAG: hypothetical protein ACYTGL_00225 [Planctomycetota bacterium]|jgi:hypothetical protein